MKKAFNVLISIILLLSASFLGYQAARIYPPGGPLPADTTIIEKVVPGDVRLVEVETTVPEPVLIDTGHIIRDTVYRDIDTAEILEDYFKMREYRDTILKDSNFRAVYQLAVYENRLESFQLKHQNLRATKVFEKHIHNYKNGIFVGGSAILAPDAVNLAPSLMYTNGKDAWQLSVGLIAKDIRFTYHRRLRLRPP